MEAWGRRMGRRRAYEILTKERMHWRETRKTPRREILFSFANLGKQLGLKCWFVICFQAKKNREHWFDDLPRTAFLIFKGNALS